MRDLEDLIEEAEAADVTGWGFGYLDGRATEERPPWGYAHLLAEHLAQVDSALDLDTGGGEVLSEAPVLPPHMVATEAWEPNAQRARELLGPRGVRIVPGTAELPDASFALVTSRHPVVPDFPEIHRLLRPGGAYLAQHVGPASCFELIEWFLGPQPEARKGRDPQAEAARAEAAGLVVDEIRTATCRIEYHDVGAIVWILRKCPWWVPGFTAGEHLPRLRELDARLRVGEPFVDASTRHLVRAHRPH
ncbi:methyltransferase domain-containing protein [Brachybacterium hainanense]|uniref:Methyltransferase domain-containing protein n=1 Tax=Brachybacterium hainanense TaxID=1541174 RepID=A0ABV6RHI2_9MICO